MPVLKKLYRYRIIHLFIAGVLLAICFLSNRSNHSESSLNNAVKVFNTQFAGFEKETDSVINHLKEINDWYKYPIENDYVNYLFQRPYTVLKYQHDTLTFWNNNQIIASPQVFTSQSEYALLKLKNGYYLARKKTDPKNTFLFLLPVKLEYNTTNDYLHSGYYARFNIDYNIDISPTNIQNGRSIKLPANSGMFYIYFNPETPNSNLDVFLYLAYIIGLIMLLEFIIELSKTLFKPSSAYLGLIHLLLFILSYFLLKEELITPKYFALWQLFNPDYYASPFIANSLGILIIQSFLFFYLCIKFYLEKIYVRQSVNGNIERATIHIVFTYLFGYLLYAVIRSLIIDSNISFEFFNPYNPDYYNLFTFSIIALLITGYCLLAQKLIRIVTDYPEKRTIYIYLFISAVISIIIYLLGNDNFDLFFLLIFINIFIIGSYFLKIKNIFSTRIGNIFMLLIFFSTSTSIFIRHYNREKEIGFRLSYAKKITNERDNVTEYLLGEIRNPILNDPLVHDYFSDTKSMPTSKVIERLNKNYFHDGFNRFDAKYYFYDAKGQPISNAQEETMIKNEQLISNSEVCDEHELYFISEPAGSFTYVAEYPIKKEDVLEGTLMVQLASKVYKAVNVYPELLLEEKNKLPLSDYSFCIYNGKIIAEHAGDYIYPNYNVFQKDSLGDNDYYVTKLDNYSHLIYKRDKEKMVVVSMPLDQTARYLSNFSYIFMVLLLTGMLLALTFNFGSLFARNAGLGFISNASFRAFIQFSFFIIILSAVLIIGLLTTQFFIRQFNKNTEERLNEKLEMVVESADFLTGQKPVITHQNTNAPYLVNLLRENVTNLSSIQDIDVNFYNLQGDLITTSEPAIFEKSLISKKMNPEAYYKLTSKSLSRLVQKEKIGSLTFLSGYQPLIRKDGSPIVYLNIPFFNTTKDLNEQIGIFFASLVSIVVFALIIAGLLAPLISRTITRRLSIIADKFKQVTLGRKNEPIEWHTKDEIGSLVNEFNKMILKLDTNAELLARSERESAWREMAKQVAHEIKNPLTPMKLSIQHLQRAYQSDAPNKDELSKKVAATLIEQIDNLSKIANEFSSFAKMPVSDMQNFSLHEVLKSSFDLFKENESVDLSYNPLLEDVHIIADKSQLLRVFNNLILNAIQAIPEGRAGKVEVSTSSTDRFVRIEITDNGKGISEEDTDKVFVPNFTTKSSGTGLGLAISKNIIESFGGKIGFNSLTEGTTFYVELPRARN